MKFELVRATSSLEDSESPEGLISASEAGQLVEPEESQLRAEPRSLAVIESLWNYRDLGLPWTY